MSLEVDGTKIDLRKVALRLSKAAIKGVVLVVGYIVLSQFLAPASEFLPGFERMLEAFVIGYLVLIIAHELASDTIVRHFLSAGKTLYVMAYLIYSLQSGIVNVTYNQMNIMIDVRLLLVIATLLCLLGLAKTVLEALHGVNEKAELAYFEAK
jgi:hypothetical protein